MSHRRREKNYSHGKHGKHGKNIATENTEKTIPVAAEWQPLGVLVSG
jgi:hypothetical protein